MPPIPGISTSPGALRKLVRLLVVDEHGEHFDLLAECAEMYDPEYKIECRLVKSQEEAVSAAADWTPSVVLVDLHLAGSQGIQLLQRFTDRGAAVVATSAVRSPELAEIAQQYGAAGYAAKSDNPEEVEALIQLVASVSCSTAPLH